MNSIYLDNSLRGKYMIIWGAFSVENEANFEKVYLDVSKDGEIFQGVHFGLYRCFTVLTQHTYGTKDELLFILGVMSLHKNKMETGTHEFYKKFTKTRKIAYDLAEEDTLEEMKRIGSIEGIEVKASTVNEAYNKYFYVGSRNFLTGNYFYWYKIGKGLFHECEIIANSMLEV